MNMIVPDTYEQPDLSKGLPMYEFGGFNIIGYIRCKNAHEYTPIIMNKRVCGWVGPQAK
jgi:hypothetical protein